MRNLDFDRAIDVLARRQHGAFNIQQVGGAGGNRRMAADRVAAGLWYQLTPSTFALAAYPPTWRRQAAAAQLSVPGAVLCGGAAGHLHRLDGCPAVRPQIAVPYTANTRCPIAGVHRTRFLRSTVVDGIAVTTVAQTLYELLHERRLDAVERAADGALLRGQVTAGELRDLHVALVPTRKPHVETFGSLVADRGDDAWAPPESELEALAWPLLRSLPGLDFERQAPIPWRSPGAGRVDALCPALRLIVELDGRAWHARVADFDRDHWRDAEAMARGYRTLRFTWLHITARPAEVADLIRQAATWTTTPAAAAS